MFRPFTQRNHRAEHESVLDVRLHEPPSRQARRRTVLGAFVACLGLGGALYGGLHAWRWAEQQLFDGGLFSLQSLQISTEGVWLRPDQVRFWAGVKEGENLLRLDLPRIRRDLELIPQIETVSVERVLPHLLRIHVTERDPIAQVQSVEPEGANGLAPATFYLDRAGMVMPPLPVTRSSPELTRAFEDLPILRGISPAELQPGRILLTLSVRRALKFVEQFGRSPLANQCVVRSVDLSRPDLLRITTRHGAEITLTRNDLDTQIERWRLVHEAGLRLSKALASLDLSVTNNCPVLWLQTTQIPPSSPKPTTPARFRRRHV